MGVTFKYSFVISWYCWFMVPGGGRAWDLIRRKITPEIPTPIAVYKKTFLPSPGGGRARGPWGPNAIQYAEVELG